MDEGLWCFRQYLWTQVTDDASPTEAVKQYREYENSYRKHHATVYFNAHKTDGIIREQYDPSLLTRMFDLQLSTARYAAEELTAEVQAGTYKELSLTAVGDTGEMHDSSPAGHDQLSCKREIAGHGLAPHFPFDPDVCTLSFDEFPSSFTVWNFHEVFQQCKGFASVWLTPSKFGVAERVGYVRFQSSDDLEAALTKLSGLSICDAKYVLQPKRVRPHSGHSADVVPSIASEPEQVEKDLALALELISSWDAAKEIPHNCQESIRNSLASIEGSVAKLDLSILYLRRVHNICFYSGTVCSNERELAECCGVTRLRLPARAKQDAQQTEAYPKVVTRVSCPVANGSCEIGITDTAGLHAGMPLTISDGTNSNNVQETTIVSVTSNGFLGKVTIADPLDFNLFLAVLPAATLTATAPEAKWAKEHEARIRQLVQKGREFKRPEVCCSLDEEPLRSRWAKKCEEYTLKVEEAKFRCKICQKLFRGPEFVHKHLRKFHPEPQKKFMDDFNEERMREAFLADGDVVKSIPLPTFKVPPAAAARTIPTPVRQPRGNWDR